MNGQPMQAIAEQSEVNFLEVDLREFFQSGVYEEALRRAAEDTKRVFQSHREVPLRAIAFRLAEDDCLLVITTHQLLMDGLSTRVLLQELSLLYQALLVGKQPNLPLPAFSMPISRPGSETG